MRSTHLPVVLLLFLSGCKVGPVYEPPCMECPTTWHSEIPEESSHQELNSAIWWENLQDPILNELMHEAAAQNLDLKIAALRVLQARTLAKGKKGDLYPHIDGSISYDHAYFSKEAAVNTLEHMGASVDSSQVNRNLNLFEFGFDAEWELDFFGLAAHEIAALKAQAEAAQESLCEVWVTLSAEIAKNYIELRGLQERKKILLENVEDQVALLQLTKELVSRGMLNESDAHLAKAECKFLQSELPSIELNVSRTIHRLSVLLGYCPADLFERLTPEGNLPQIPSGISIGIPSDLLRRRPDIRKAERELAASTEKVGSAIASLFPRFSLKGFVGDISTKTGSLFNASSTTWFLGPQVLVPIFNSRLLLQEVAYNKMVEKGALYEYQKTVIGALEEAENAISGFTRAKEQQDYLIDADAHNRAALALVDELQQRGFNDRFQLNKVKKAALKAKERLIQSHIDLLLNYVTLYKTLGGSWDCEEE